MTYALIDGDTVLKYPIYEGDLRTELGVPHYEENFIPPAEYQLVQDVATPSVDYTKNVLLGTPELIDGVWTQVWKVEEASDDDIAKRIENKSNLERAYRNELLQATDWTQLADSPTDPSAWAIYRQALRDITKQETFPWEIEWPQKPNT